MSDLGPIVADARERLMQRARREGLETVGYRIVDSPLGPLWIAVGPRGLLNIHYGAEPSSLELRRIVRAYGPGVLPDARRVDDVARELDQYWSGKRREFDVAVDLSPLTPFQRRVLAVTARVPYGELITYAKVAHKTGTLDESRNDAAIVRGERPVVVAAFSRKLTDTGAAVSWLGVLGWCAYRAAGNSGGPLPPELTRTA